MRNAYRLNKDFQSLVFDDDQKPSQTLVGFGDLPKNHVIDWSLFVDNVKAPGEKYDNPDFPDDDQRDPRRLQFAYKLDTSLVDPLAHLPQRISGDDVGTTFASLAARNLKRGYNFRLPSGQQIAAVLGRRTPPLLQIGEKLLRFVDPDPNKQIKGFPSPTLRRSPLTRRSGFTSSLEAQQQMLKGAAAFKTKIVNDEPVIAKDPDDGTQLGPVGGRIVLEVFYGVLDSDPESGAEPEGLVAGRARIGRGS